jgi:hypothetical protein
MIRRSADKVQPGPRGEIQLKFALLGKISFWLIVIGALALLTPQPAWPEWLARMVLSAGIALGLTTLGVSLWRKGDKK